MIEKHEVKEYEIDMRCNSCNKGYMRPDGPVLTTYPLKYPHKCTVCQHKEIYTTTYPHIEYERVTVAEEISPVHYEPMCPIGMTDCIADPAYVKLHHPDWYTKLYGDSDLVSAVDQGCKPYVEEGYCPYYDDEDK